MHGLLYFTSSFHVVINQGLYQDDRTRRRGDDGTAGQRNLFLLLFSSFSVFLPRKD